METASCHRLGVAVETGGQAGARTALVTTGPAQQSSGLAVRADRRAASLAVSRRLHEQTGGGEEEGDERREERTGGGEVPSGRWRRKRRRRRWAACLQRRGSLK